MRECISCDKKHERYMASHGAVHERNGLEYCLQCKGHFRPELPHECEPYKYHLGCKDCEMYHDVAAQLPGDIQIESMHHISDKDGWCVVTSRPGQHRVIVSGEHHKHHKHHLDTKKNIVVKIAEAHS